MSRSQRRVAAGDDRIARYALVGLIVASAVTIDPFGLQSFLYLRYALTLTALLFLVLVMWRGGVALPRSRVVIVTAATFIGLVLVASVLARAPIVALLGASGRQLGWVAWVVFAVAFVVGLSTFDTSSRESLAWSLTVGFSVALIAAGLVGLLEVAGSPIVETDQSFGTRLQSSFGNPAVLAAFVSLALPTVVGAAVAKRLLYLTVPAAASGILLLALSGTRGAWIGLAVGMAFAATAILMGERSWSMRVVVVVVLVGLTVVAASALTGRWTTAASAFEGRVATWGVAGRVVADNAAIGVGPEGLATAFAETVDEGYVITYTRDDVVDRAHNGVLDVAVSGGLIAVGAYLVLIAATLFMFWRASGKRDPDGWVITGAAAGGVAYLVQQQVLFQLAVLDLVFWLVVGLIAATAGFAAKRRPMRGAVGAMAVFVALVGLYTFVGVYADRLDRNALRPGEAHGIMDDLETAARLRPSDDIHAIVAAEVSGRVGDPGINWRAGRIVDSGLGVNPTNGVLILERSGLLVDVFEMTGNERALDVAQVDLDELVLRDTTNGDAFLRLGAIAFFKGDYEAAEQHWLRAQVLMPHRQEPTANLAVLRQNTE